MKLRIGDVKTEEATLHLRLLEDGDGYISVVSSRNGAPYKYEFEIRPNGSWRKTQNGHLDDKSV